MEILNPVGPQNYGALHLLSYIIYKQASMIAKSSFTVDMLHKKESKWPTVMFRIPTKEVECIQNNHLLTLEEIFHVQYKFNLTAFVA